MPEALGNPPSPRTALFWNGTEWQWALVDAAGQLQVDVIASGLPAGAATAAAQALALAQLELIEDMRDALQSVATDRLQVRGEDQLYSWKGVVGNYRSSVISGADGAAFSQPVPANTIWKITNVVARDNTNPITEIWFRIVHDAVESNFYAEIRAIAAGELVPWGGEIWLDPADTVGVYFIGGLVGDTCHIWLVGHAMTLEV